MPPYLAGRKSEELEFRELLKQDVITRNLVLTGLRGVGKTVLLDSFKPIAQDQGWVWVGTDLSESASVSEDRLARRLMTDIAPVTSTVSISQLPVPTIGFGSKRRFQAQALDDRLLLGLYEQTPGLVVDKITRVLECAWSALHSANKRGVVFAYDEAQTMADHAKKEEYPLAVLLQLFQSLQRKNIPFLLILTGLPMLQAKLVESRTYAERMFHVIFLDRLDENDSRDAITKPLEKAKQSFTKKSVDTIIQESDGYPYFIQFICREVFDLFVAGSERVPVSEILTKLDADFFAGRWQRLTDRQRDLLTVAACLPNAGGEFTVQEITERSGRRLPKGFTASHVNQMLSSLGDKGLVFKNRHGKYSFAVPLLHRFIARQSEIE